MIVLDGVLSWCSRLADTTVGLGEPCSVDPNAYKVEGSVFDDCAAGLVCWAVDADGEGRCARLCEGSAAAPECAADEHCPVGFGFGANVCVPSCDPLGDDCDEGSGCYLLDGAWGCYPRIVNFPGTAGTACSFPHQCLDGFACLREDEFSGCPFSAGHGSCCARVCVRDDPAADQVCAADDAARTCQPWLDDAEASTAGVLGVCVP